MRAFAVVGFIVLSFIVWWPAGIALVLVGLWMAGIRKESGAAEPAGVAETAQSNTTELQHENQRLRHELMLRDIFNTVESIQSKVDVALEDEATKHPSVPAYHAWNVIHDLAHDIGRGATDANPELRASMLALLQYIERASESLVRLVTVDERWKLYRGRSLEFEDLREMRGLARVVLDHVIRTATQVPEP